MEHLGIRGRVTVTAYPRGALERLLREGWSYNEARRQVGALDSVSVNNAIVDTGRNLVAEIMADDAGTTAGTYDTGITYCAIGTDNTAAADAQTTLIAESERLEITAVEVTDNVVVYSTFFRSTQCAIAMEEVGLFGHDATDTTDSGEMFNRALLSYDNSAGNFDLTIDVTITFG